MFEKVKKLTEDCSCGKRHSLLTDEFTISDDAESLMAEYLVSRGFHSPALICDTNTAVFTERIREKISVRPTLTLPSDAHATEVYAARAEEFIKSEKPDVLIACGSGSVHDITRFAAHKTSLPFVSYPTAASVDGFVSGVAAMTWHSQKLTFEAVPPIALFASPEVFVTAPERLTASGVGDVLGKYNSLFDWQTARILTGEYHCPSLASVETEAVDELVDAIKKRGSISKTEYTTKVMYALILSGIAMQLAGNSRPASGAEHHMSHLWEMHLINDEVDALHGEKVALGLLEVTKVYKNALSAGLDFDRIEKIDLSRVFDANRLKPVFGSLTDATLKENLPAGTLASSSLAKINLSDRDGIISELNSAARSLPSYEETLELCRLADIPTSPEQIGLPSSGEFITTSLRYAPYVRNRITLLKVLSAAELI